MVDAMEQAGSTDLRAHVDLPLALRIIGRPGDSSLRRAVDQLRAWQRAGGQRKDANKDGTYEHADAIRLMDAWWPLWVRAQFRPALGARPTRRCSRRSSSTTTPNNHGDHLGSAYQTGWYGYVRKDLRTVLKRKVRGSTRARTAAAAGCGAAARCCGARCATPSAPRAATSTADDEVCADEGKAERPVVLRRGAPAPGRRRDAAADPLDQPAHLPAGGRGPGPRALADAHHPGESASNARAGSSVRSPIWIRASRPTT